ncbi:MAG: SUF system NifU family Fe-S cluster assembly protein [Chloroflexi bacterium]|nr:SUF system NifU family Fe-S cluster assembly protein [Chloroflexota bacterium]
MSLSDELYREIILDHYKNPRHAGRLDPADLRAEGNNPLCGDEIEITVNLRDGTIADIRFHGRGCSISQASASMMTENIVGKPIAEVEELVGLFKGMMLENQEPDPERIGDLESLQGVKKYPVRIKCALLAWNTLLEALNEGSKK